jgi:hypothetical protein
LSGLKSKDRRGEKLDNLTEDEALGRIVNKAKFRTGQTKERRKMTNPIKETWLFVEADGTHNALGKALLKSFGEIYKSKAAEPSYGDVFSKFYSATSKTLPKKTKTIKGETSNFTEDDWKKKAQGFLKSYVKKAMKEQGRKIDGRASKMLRSSRGDATKKQREEAVSFFDKLGAFTEEVYATKKEKTALDEAYNKLESVAERQQNLLEG